MIRMSEMSISFRHFSAMTMLMYSCMLAVYVHIHQKSYSKTRESTSVQAYTTRRRRSADTGTRTRDRERGRGSRKTSGGPSRGSREPHSSQESGLRIIASPSSGTPPGAQEHSSRLSDLVFLELPRYSHKTHGYSCIQSSSCTQSNLLLSALLSMAR